MKTLRTLALGLAALLVPGCELLPVEGPDGPLFGFVVMGEYESGVDAREVFGYGTFVAFTEPLPDEAFLEDPYEARLETCEIASIDAAGALPEVPLPAVPGRRVDAGEALTLRSDGDTIHYATLDRLEGMVGREPTVAYVLSEPVAGRLPDDLAITVPGAVFPHFVAEPFPDVVHFELAAPAPAERSEIAADTVFEWEPSGAANAVVVLGVVSRTLGILVRCHTADDGIFAFPPETAGVLGPSFQGRVDTAGRITFRVVRGADAVLVLGAASSREFVYRPDPVF